MSDPIEAKQITFRGQKAFQLPSGRIVTLEAWESVTDEARKAILAGEQTSPDALPTEEAQ